MNFHNGFLWEMFDQDGFGWYFDLNLFLITAGLQVPHFDKRPEIIAFYEFQHAISSLDKY